MADRRKELRDERLAEINELLKGDKEVGRKFNFSTPEELAAALAEKESKLKSEVPSSFNSPELNPASQIGQFSFAQKQVSSPATMTDIVSSFQQAQQSIAVVDAAKEAKPAKVGAEADVVYNDTTADSEKNALIGLESASTLTLNDKMLSTKPLDKLATSPYAAPIKSYADLSDGTAQFAKEEGFAKAASGELAAAASETPKETTVADPNKLVESNIIGTLEGLVKAGASGGINDGIQENDAEAVAALQAALSAGGVSREITDKLTVAEGSFIPGVQSRELAAALEKIKSEGPITQEKLTEFANQVSNKLGASALVDAKQEDVTTPSQQASGADKARVVG